MFKPLPIPPELNHLIEKREQEERRSQERRQAADRRAKESAAGADQGLDLGDATANDQVPERRTGTARRQTGNRRTTSRRSTDEPDDSEG